RTALMVMVAPNEAKEGSKGSEATTLPQILDLCLASAVVAIDERQRITAFTPEAENLLRLTAQQALDRAIEILPSPLREIVQKTLLSGESLSDRQILLPAGAGIDLIVRVSTTAIRGPGGKPIGAIAVLNNLTPARHLEQNLRRMDRLASIGTLSASMA